MSYQKFTKNIGIVGFTNFLVALEKIIILPIITKLLGVESYGIWAQFGVTIGLITPLALLGLHGAIVRFLAAEKDRKELQEGVYSVLFLVLITCSIIAFFLILFSQPIAGFLQTDQILIKILSFVILFECLGLVLLSIFQAMQEIKKYSFFMIFRIFGEVGLIIGAILLGYGLYGAVLSLLIIRIITFLILFALILKKIGISIPRFSRIREYLRFSLPRVVGSVSYWTVTSSDRYLIGFFLGILFVGYYAPAYAIGNVMNFLLYPLFFMLPVVLSKAFDENKLDEVKVYLKYSLKYFLILGIPMFFGISLLSKQLLIIFSTEEIALNSFYIIPFVSLSILLYGITSLVGAQILMLVKKTRIIGTVWILAALFNLGLNILLIPKFGILAAAITTLLSYTLAFILITYYSYKELKFKMDWIFIIKSVLASIMMALFILWFNPTGLLNTMIAVTASISIYGILIILLKGFNKEEINFLKGFIFHLPANK